MEMTAKAIREVEFREKLRGYHPEDVDAFVEEIAAGIEALQARMRDGDQSGFSGSTGTTPAPTDGGAPVTEDMLRRTLLMAQRTADLVLSDAQESAAGVLAEARAEAASVLADSKAQARRIAAETERHAKAAQHDVVADLARMEAVRDRLSEEIATLGEYLDTQRARIRDSLLEQLHVLEGARTQLDPPPVTSGKPAGVEKAGPNGNGAGPSKPTPSTSERASSEPVGQHPTGGRADEVAPGSGSAPATKRDAPQSDVEGTAKEAPQAPDTPPAANGASDADRNAGNGTDGPTDAAATARRVGSPDRGAVAPASSSHVDVFSRGRSPDDVFLHDGDGEDPFLAGLRQARDEPARFDRHDADHSAVAEASGADRGMGHGPVGTRPNSDLGPMTSSDDDGPSGRLFRRN